MHKKILIVEDHPIIIESIETIVKNSGLDASCSGASTAAKGLAFLNGSEYDLILLDINLPDMNGIEFCKIAKSRFPDLKILAITTMAQRHVVEAMLQNGANGFIFKSTDTGDILNGIRQLLNGANLYFGNGVKELIHGNQSENNDSPSITKRESEILRLIAEGLTNQEIGDKLFISPLTVDTHRKNLLLKFNARNTAILIKTAVSKGYVN